ncbi:unnamed protein product, partial [Rotaria sp. Silwood1]
MSATHVSKDDGKKLKSNRNRSGQQAQIVTQSSTIAEPAVQPGNHYDNWFLPRGESSLSQASS